MSGCLLLDREGADCLFSVLLVEPDSDAQTRLLPILETEGYRVLTANDGESALLAFEEHLPELLLLASDLEGLSGKEVCDAVKARAGDAFVPVMIMAAQAAGDDASVYDAGAD